MSEAITDTSKGGGTVVEIVDDSSSSSGFHIDTLVKLTEDDPDYSSTSGQIKKNDATEQQLDLERGIDANFASDSTVAKESETNKQDCSSTTLNSNHDSSAQQQEILRTTPGAFAIERLIGESGVVSGPSTAILRTTPELRQSMSLGFRVRAPDETLPTLAQSETACALLSSQDIYRESGEEEQTNVIRAVLVKNNTHIYEASPVESVAEDNMKNKWSSKTLFLCAASAILFVLVTTMAFVVAGKTKGEKSMKMNPGSTPDPLKEKRRDYLLSLLAPLSGPAEEQVFNRGNNTAMSMDRINALSWLVEDTRNKISLTTERNDPITNKSVAEPVPLWKLRQRYVLALFYFATDGVNWDDQYFFLSTQDECQWTKRFPLANGEKQMGVSCNDEGRVTGISSRWNGLAGTLPHELCFLEDTFEHLNLAGDLMTGTIPEEYERFTKLRTLVLDDNCIDGTIPQSLLRLPTLTRVSFVNTPWLSAPMNEFCNRQDYKEGTISIAGDCSGETNGCECCTCCNPDTFRCTDRESGNSWNSYNLNAFTERGFVKSFRKNTCRTENSKHWIANECPYIINSNTNLDTNRFEGECTKNGAQKGAQISHDAFLWF